MKKNEKLKILVVILLVLIESAFSFSEKNIWDVLRYGFLYIDFSNSNRALESFIRILFPQIVILFLFGDYFEENICKNADILFTRTRKCGRVLGKYVGKLLLVLNTICIEILVVISLFYFLRGYSISVGLEEIMAVCLFLAYINVLVLLANAISFFTSAITGTFMVVVLEIVSIYVFASRGNALGILCILPTATLKILQEPMRLEMMEKELLSLLVWFGLILGCTIGLLRKKEWL